MADTMPLSAAIRLGAMLHPQCFGRIAIYGYTQATELPQIVATCALGAAWAAIGCDERTPAEWERFLREWAACPHCTRVAPLTAMITHLNDIHRLSREAIADFVQSIEAQQLTADSAVVDELEVAHA